MVASRFSGNILDFERSLVYFDGPYPARDRVPARAHFGLMLEWVRTWQNKQAGQLDAVAKSDGPPNKGNNLPYLTHPSTTYNILLCERPEVFNVRRSNNQPEPWGRQGQSVGKKIL